MRGIATPSPHTGQSVKWLPVEILLFRFEKKLSIANDKSFSILVLESMSKTGQRLVKASLDPKFDRS